MSKRLILVVGVGRSGTSLFAGIMGQLGFRIPQPEIVADDTNPKGFGEPKWVVDFHTRIMRRKRVTVFDARPQAWELTAAASAEPEVREELRSWLNGEVDQASDVVVVKDPRIGWFLPLWTGAAAEVGVPTSFVTMLRHPAQILTSAKKSYGTWQTDASRAAAWLNVMLETERATRGTQRAFVPTPTCWPTGPPSCAARARCWASSSWRRSTAPRTRRSTRSSTRACSATARAGRASRSRSA